MSVVYIPSDNMDVWKSLGTALGTYLGKRAQDIQKTHEAKEYANAWFPNLTGSQPQEAKTMADYVQMPQDNTPTIPRISGGGLLQNAFSAAQNAMPSITASAQPITGTTTSGGVVGSGLLSGNVQNGAQMAAGAAAGNGGTTIAPSLANAAQAYMAQPNFNSAPQEQAPNDGQEGNGLPSVPDRQAIRQKNMADNGAVYRDLYVSTVKAGYSPEEARAMTLDRVKQDEDSAYNAQRSEYISKVLNPMKEQILNELIFTKDKNGNTVVGTYNSSKLPGLIPAINRYNEMAANAGAQGLDLNSLNSISKLTKPDYKYMQGKNGHIVRINGDNGAVSDAGDFSDPRDQYIRTTAGFWDVKNRKFITDPATMKKIEIDQQRANAQDRVANSTIAMNNYKMTHPAGGGGNGGTSGLTSQQISTLRQLHMTWMKNNPDKNESDSPWYSALMSTLPAMGGGSSGGQQDPVDARIDALRQQGWSPEKIIAGLKASGNDAYVSHVW